MMSSLGLSPINIWILSCLFGLSSVVMIAMCMKKKKRNSITMIRYIQSDEYENAPEQRTRTSTNGTGFFTRETDQRHSQHSIPNENRTLPEIPKSNGNGNTDGTPPTPEQVATPAMSVDGSQRNSNSSPKKSRRLPALPPSGNNGNVDITPSCEPENSKEIDATYEDLRDTPEPGPGPSVEIVGSGDSDLYARVPEDVNKQEDDSDLYAQVGAAGDTDGVKKPLVKTLSSDKTDKNRTGGRNSTSSDEDKLMDSPSAVTYASVDKMKKTMSIKRNNNSTASLGAPPPPVPDRNFDEEDEVSITITENLPPPPAITQEIPSTSSPPDNNIQPIIQTANDTEERTGPAYDTVSVRESFAHQRLRQMVEDEQRNRYVNTNPVVGPTSNPDVYSQIEDENSEAVYESVSVPGSADGTVGVTGRNLPSNSNPTRGEHNYVMIDTGAIPDPPNGEILNPDYENINPR